MFGQNPEDGLAVRKKNMTQYHPLHGNLVSSAQLSYSVLLAWSYILDMRSVENRRAMKTRSDSELL